MVQIVKVTISLVFCNRLERYFTPTIIVMGETIGLLSIPPRTNFIPDSMQHWIHQGKTFRNQIGITKV